VNILDEGSELSDPEYVRKAAALGEGRRVRRPAVESKSVQMTMP
jgi:hypothetical protein